MKKLYHVKITLTGSGKNIIEFLRGSFYDIPGCVRLPKELANSISAKSQTSEHFEFILNRPWIMSSQYMQHVSVRDKLDIEVVRMLENQKEEEAIHIEKGTVIKFIRNKILA